MISAFATTEHPAVAAVAPICTTAVLASSPPSITIEKTNFSRNSISQTLKPKKKTA